MHKQKALFQQLIPERSRNQKLLKVLYRQKIVSMNNALQRTLKYVTINLVQKWSQILLVKALEPGTLSVIS